MCLERVSERALGYLHCDDHQQKQQQRRWTWFLCSQNFTVLFAPSRLMISFLALSSANPACGNVSLYLYFSLPVSYGWSFWTLTYLTIDHFKWLNEIQKKVEKNRTTVKSRPVFLYRFLDFTESCWCELWHHGDHSLTSWGVDECVCAPAASLRLHENGLLVSRLPSCSCLLPWNILARWCGGVMNILLTVC